MATLVARPVKRRVDDTFFVAMSLIILATELIGFAHTYFLAGMVRAHLPSLLVHLHGAAFTCWIVLFVVQTVLIANRNVRLHRTLGTAGGFLAAAMVILGLAVSQAAVRRGATPPVFEPAMFLGLNGIGMLLFGILVGWAILERNNGPTHKRLMLLATFNLIPPGVGRLPFAFIRQHPPLIGGSLFLFVLALVLFDLFTRRTVLRATIIGGVMVLAVFPVATALGHTPPMQHLAANLIQHP